MNYSDKHIDVQKIKKFVRIRKKYKLYFNQLSNKYELPPNLLIGIYLIETKFRPWYFRVGEYTIVLLGIVLNSIFNKPLKNYTIGKCQIGLSSILKYEKRDSYKHACYLHNVSKYDYVTIIKSVYYKLNFEICAEMVSRFYKRALNTSGTYSTLIRHVGEEFNGRYSYGLLLEDIVKLLDHEYKSETNKRLD